MAIGSSTTSKLTETEAVNRLVEMLPFVRKDIVVSIEVRATLEVGNEMLSALPTKDRRFLGANSYNVVSRSLALELVAALSRLCDTGSKRRPNDDKDVCSIPQLMHFLSQDRCKRHLVWKQHDWFAQAPILARQFPASCGAAIDRALDAFADYQRAPKFIAARQQLKSFRDAIVAHSLMGKSSDRPTFSAVYALHDAILRISEPVIYAIDSTQHCFAAEMEHWRSEAHGFWRRVFRVQPAVSTRLEPEQGTK